MIGSLHNCRLWSCLRMGNENLCWGSPPGCALGHKGVTDWSAVLMQQLAEAVHSKQAPHEHALGEERKKKNYREFWAVISLKDPFRLVLSEMRDRLFHTREILHHCLVHPKCAPCPCGTPAEEPLGHSLQQAC